jgi:hypothetical protein
MQFIIEASDSPCYDLRPWPMKKTPSDDAQPLADFTLGLNRVTVLLRVTACSLSSRQMIQLFPLSEAACVGAVHEENTRSDNAQL